MVFFLDLKWAKAKLHAPSGIVQQQHQEARRMPIFNEMVVLTDLKQQLESEEAPCVVPGWDINGLCNLPDMAPIATTLSSFVQ